MRAAVLRAREILSHEPYRRLWLVGLYAGLARWFELLAVTVYVYQLTGSPTRVAIVVAARMTPMLLLGPLAGVFGDSGDRRVLLLRLFAVMSVAPALIAVSIFTGTVAYPAIVVAAFVSGLGFVGDLALRRTLLADTIDPDRLVLASGLDSTTNNATRMVGPLLSGIAYPLLGGAGVYLVVAAINALCFVMLLGKGTGEDRAGGAVPDPIRWRSAFLPPLAVLADIRLLAAFALSALFNLSAFPFISMIPVYAADRLGASATLTGLIAATEGFGATVGTLIVAGLVTAGAVFRWHFAGVGGCLVMILGLSYAENIGTVLAGAFVLGAFGAFFMGTQYALIHTLAPKGMRSRTFGLLCLFIGFTVLGSLNLGYLTDAYGVATAMHIVVAESILPFIAIGLLWRHGGGSRATQNPTSEKEDKDGTAAPVRTGDL